MSPLEIEILLHYCYSPHDYREGDFSARSVRKAINNFCGYLGLLENETDHITVRRTYKLSSRGEAFVAKLCSTPLPTLTWTYPEEGK